MTCTSPRDLAESTRPIPTSSLTTWLAAVGAALAAQVAAALLVSAAAFVLLAGIFTSFSDTSSSSPGWGILGRCKSGPTPSQLSASNTVGGPDGGAVRWPSARPSDKAHQGWMR